MLRKEEMECLVNGLFAYESGGELEMGPIHWLVGKSVKHVIIVVFESILLIDHQLIIIEKRRFHLPVLLVDSVDIIEYSLHEHFIAHT